MAAETRLPVTHLPDTPPAYYDAVAAHYDKVFTDITVRRDEWRWLQQHCTFKAKTVLDLGCGNGALLARLAPELCAGTGADISENMLTLACAKAKAYANLRFVKLSGSVLPFQTAGFDIVLSFFSFRYLDWEQTLPEIIRVLKPGGRFILIDMAGAVPRWHQFPSLVLHKIKFSLQLLFKPAYKQALAALVKQDSWQQMLAAHPIRQCGAYKQFFRTWLPGSRLKVINVAWKAQTLGLACAPLVAGKIPAVALLDWGIGGLSVYRILKARFPQAELCYISDSGFTPYGKVPEKLLVRRLEQILRFLCLRKATHLIVACNAMSTVLQGRSFPFRDKLELTGVILPAVRSLEQKAYRSIGIIGGRRTIDSHIYRILLQTEIPHIREQVAQPLSAYIERGETDSPAFIKTLDKIITPLEGVQALILGCTHYTAIKALIRERMADTELIDPSTLTAGWVTEHWELSGTTGEDLFITTGNAEEMMTAANTVFGIEIKAVLPVNLAFELRK